jgi:hypothetical protein
MSTNSNVQPAALIPKIAKMLMRELKGPESVGGTVVTRREDGKWRIWVVACGMLLSL